MPVEVSEREAEVLAAIGAHLSNAQIAGKLHISVRGAASSAATVASVIAPVVRPAPVSPAPYPGSAENSR